MQTSGGFLEHVFDFNLIRENLMHGWFIELIRGYFCIEWKKVILLYIWEDGFILIVMDSNASYISTVIHIM